MIPTILAMMENWYTHIAADILSSGITSFSRTNHKPTVSASMKIAKAIIICICMAVRKVVFRCSSLPFAMSTFKYRCVALAIAPFKKLNIETTPPTTLLMPQSVTPSVCNMTRDVNRDTAMVKNMRMYNITVFFAMRLLSDEFDVIMFSALFNRAHSTIDP